MRVANSTKISWDFGDKREDRIHRIHPYPAKFPAFITTRALQYAAASGVNVRRVADVFCGCGTTAVEAKRNGKDFWGCDINPLATLIAQVKTHRYRDIILARSLGDVWKAFNHIVVSEEERDSVSDRIRYWFDDEHVEDLLRLRGAIKQSTRAYSAQRKFFLCGFSAILKATSYWLTKSIKPQRDLNKKPRNVIDVFDEQITKMRRANEENEFPRSNAKTAIRTEDFVGGSFNKDPVDLIVTSPPYVTSYDYADIHQLSTLWLGYTNDYRSLRSNMLGNRHGVNAPNATRIRELGSVAWRTYQNLCNEDPSRASSIARYFMDLDKAVRRCSEILAPSGMAVFVIGNTQYKGVNVDNAKFLASCMKRTGFTQVTATPRKVSRKIMTPYRDRKGRFTRNPSERQTYAEEFVLTGMMQ